MSQAQKIGLMIFGVAFFISAATAIAIQLQKNKLAQEKAYVEDQLGKSQKDGVKKQQQIDELNAQMEALNQEKAKIEQQLDKASKKVDELGAKVKELGDDRDKWQKRAEETKQAQTALQAKVDDLNKQVEALKAKEAELAQLKEEMESNPAKAGVAKKPSSTKSASDDIVSSNDVQWAGVLKEKAGIEVNLDDAKAELAKVSQELIELRQKNEELQISLDSVTEQKESVDREIKYKTDLVNNLSLDLARAKNDQRMKEDRITELDDENQELRKRIKQLVGSNSSLEKSMVRLNQDKRDIEKKLDSTETLVHSKINEIWDIKESIDQTMASGRSGGSRDVELPPIMVSTQPASGESAPGMNGQIVSINNENNFVVVNIGQKQGVNMGDQLSVYRGAQYIGRLEVIQVRSDISAADIKEQSTPLQTGDSVK